MLCCVYMYNLEMWLELFLLLGIVNEKKLQRKVFQRYFNLTIFKLAPLFFSETWIHCCIVVIFFENTMFSSTLYVKKVYIWYGLTFLIFHCGPMDNRDWIVRTLWNINPIFFQCYIWYFFRWYIVYKIWYLVYFPFSYWMVFRAVVEKLIQRKCGLNVFKRAPFFFSEIWTHWWIVAIVYKNNMLF